MPLRLHESEKHFDKTHKRWVEKTNRDLVRDAEAGELIITQCLLCDYYIPLTGKFVNDWGVCSNPVSIHDGRAMFEHDGCDHFIDSEDYSAD